MSNERVCDRGTHCLNFKLEVRPDCNECGVPITMNHFHDNTAGYRICHDCFVAHRRAIEAGTYRPTSWIAGEDRTCENRHACFAHAPYGLFVQKVCDRCREYPPGHYHDIHRNIRLCLSCYGALQEATP